MWYLFFKFSISAALMVAISEAAKRSATTGALIASLPLTSILAMCWLYRDTQDTVKIAQLSTEIFWLVIPSLVFFLIFPALLRRGLDFAPALAISCIATALGYVLYHDLCTR